VKRRNQQHSCRRAEVVDAANIRDVKPLSDLAFGLRSHPSAFVGDSRIHGFLARDRSGEVVAMGGWAAAGTGAKIFSIATHPERGLIGSLVERYIT
jgi:hypothetical protein